MAQLGQVWVEAVTQICLGRLAPGRGLVTSALVITAAATAAVRLAG